MADNNQDVIDESNQSQPESLEKVDNQDQQQQHGQVHHHELQQEQQQEQPNEVSQNDHQKQYSLDTVKVYAPVITQDVNISETNDKEPMAIIPVPDSQATLGLPISTINGLLNSQLKKTLKAEMDAKELLIWNGEIGVLEGCDLRFKINKHGCLELLDSDDEELGDFNNTTVQANNTTKATPLLKIPSSNGHPTPKMDQSATNEASNCEVKQISPGSSLLRGGPNNLKRPTKINQAAMMKKLETYQNGLLLEKLIPKQRIELIKTKVENWTPKEVKEFVDSIPGCMGCGQLFLKHDICGTALLFLHRREILEVIKVKLGPAIKICHVIDLLK